MTKTVNAESGKSSSWLTYYQGVENTMYNHFHFNYSPKTLPEGINTRQRLFLLSNATLEVIILNADFLGSICK